ncbi:MAG: hypothetical protein GX362_03780 [Methanosarcinaceae archaeon]|nr:hypothetical protein [Methanosarcinaceae archaeon]
MEFKESNETELKTENSKNTEIKSIEEIYDDLCTSDEKEIAEPTESEKNKPLFKEIHDIESEDRICQACVLKTGDTQYYDILKFIKDPVTSCGVAIKRNEKIYTDSESIIYLIEEELRKIYKEEIDNSEKTGKKLNLKVPDIVYVGKLKGSKEMSKKYNITEPAAGFLMLGNELNESIILTGYDEAALLSVTRLIDKGLKPAAVLAFPGGSGTQNKSKQYLREMSVDTPTISTMSAKGGREIAAICMAEIIKIVNEKINR